MFGRRPEGKRVKHLDPIVQITPYLMPWRCDAQVFLAYDAEYEPLLRYMSHKSREGVKITFMELIIAAYVRAISQVPEANRFIMNRKFYNRTELAVSFVVLRPTEDRAARGKCRQGEVRPQRYHLRGQHPREADH
ncbi:MAG: hypothetical protein ACLUE8_07070 [Lachnospiraceae bacterium]